MFFIRAFGKQSNGVTPQPCISCSPFAFLQPKRSTSYCINERSRKSWFSWPEIIYCWGGTRLQRKSQLVIVSNGVLAPQNFSGHLKTHPSLLRKISNPPKHPQPVWKIFASPQCTATFALFDNFILSYKTSSCYLFSPLDWTNSVAHR